MAFRGKVEVGNINLQVTGMEIKVMALDEIT